MKRKDLVKELESLNCSLKRNGANHDIYRNDLNGRIAPIHRHNEISETLCKLIKDQLGLVNKS